MLLNAMVWHAIASKIFSVKFLLVPGLGMFGRGLSARCVQIPGTFFEPLSSIQLLRTRYSHAGSLHCPLQNRLLANDRVWYTDLALRLSVGVGVTGLVSVPDCKCGRLSSCLCLWFALRPESRHFFTKPLFGCMYLAHGGCGCVLDGLHIGRRLHSCVNISYTFTKSS